MRPQSDSSENRTPFEVEVALRIQQCEASLENVVGALAKFEDRYHIEATALRGELRDVVRRLSDLQMTMSERIHAVDKVNATQEGKLYWVYAGVAAFVTALVTLLFTLLSKKL